jgi:hypothetical protein
MQMPQGWYMDQNGSHAPHPYPTYHDWDHYRQQQGSGSNTYAKVFSFKQSILAYSFTMMASSPYTWMAALSSQRRILPFMHYQKTYLQCTY